jgi:hypothetical protein
MGKIYNQIKQMGYEAYFNEHPRYPQTDPIFNSFSTSSSKQTKTDKIIMAKIWKKGWDEAEADYDLYKLNEYIAEAKAEALNEQILTHGPYRPDPEAEQEEARERWLEHLEYKSKIQK